MKRDIPQAVFDQFSKTARKVYQEVCKELDEQHSRKVPVGEGNPNHPMYDLQLFGYHKDEFMRKQYK